MSKIRRSILELLLLVPAAVLLLPALLLAQAPAVGKNVMSIRGKTQEVYFYPGAPLPGKETVPKVLFGPGDFGMHGHAVMIAERIASWGFDVYGLDTRSYLESFTGTTTLRAEDVMGDFRELAQWISRGTKEPMVLAGWSEGAGLALLAAAADPNKEMFAGLVVFGLTESSVLGWRWYDSLSYITKQDPKEPKFQARDFVARVSPLPLMWIHSSGDQSVSTEAARQMFALAGEPKRFVLVQAKDHRFDGNLEEFFRQLREGLTWALMSRR